jgi:uncharacterized membrane protein
MNDYSTYIYRLRHSIWYIPLLFIVMSFILFYLLDLANSLSPVLQYIYLKHWDGFLGQSANKLISVAITIVVTIFSLSVSLTMIVLALASVQIGPRIIDHFLGSKVTQIVLGFYLGTISFLMLLYARVGSNTPQLELPLLSIILGYFLVVVSPALMVYFVQHLGSSIIPDNVVRSLSNSLSLSVDKYLNKEKKYKFLCKKQLKNLEHTVLRAQVSCYFSNVLESNLIQFLTKKNYVLELFYLPGTFIVEGAEIGKIYSNKKKISDKEINLILSWVVFSRLAPVLKDVDYFLRRIVEIALRALSPGINDPYTANACLNYMFTSLQRIALSRRLPSGVYCDDRGNPRLYLPVFSVEKMYDLALNQIQQASLSQINTQMYILELITITLTSAVNKNARKHLIAHGQQIIYDIEKRTTCLAYLEKTREYKKVMQSLSKPNE